MHSKRDNKNTEDDQFMKWSRALKWTSKYKMVLNINGLWVDYCLLFGLVAATVSYRNSMQLIESNQVLKSHRNYPNI
jgi:hypothetical protein